MYLVFFDVKVIKFFMFLLVKYRNRNCRQRIIWIFLGGGSFFFIRFVNEDNYKF